jgi:hypothetical protein
MILDTLTRVDLFGKARSLNDTLGAVFQNPMEVTPEMIEEEMKEVRRLRDAEFDRYGSYLVSLRTLKAEISQCPSRING